MSYISSHKGLDIDTAVTKILTLETEGGAASQGWVNTQLDDYILKSDAANTYLTISDVANTYLSISDAADTYLSKTDAMSAYLTQTAAQNYALNSTVVIHDNYFTSANLIGSDVPNDRYCQFNIPISATGRTGCKANKDYLQICFTTTGIILYVRDASSGSWTAAWSK